MITVITEDERTFAVDVDLTIEVENLKALLEADSSIAAEDQELLFRGQAVSDAKATLSSVGVQNDDLLILRDKRRSQPSTRRSGSANSASSQAASEEQAAEQMRQQILADPAALSMLRANNPEMAEAVQNSASRFLELIKAQRDRMQMAGPTATADGVDAGADEFDVEAQRRIEEAIRRERVLEKLEHAMEYSPESFGRVTMLYVNCKVNGTDVKAFVDSGAQATIMSPECAERCGIMRLLDTRFAGIARGVGTAKILGRVHSTQLQLGNDIFLPCSFTIMEGKGVDMLFGLDMLKRYQATIDLGNNALVINGSSIRFLDEHELPAEASVEYELDDEGNPRPVTKPSRGPAGPSALGAASANANAAAASNAASASRFPGAGHQLASGPPAADEAAHMDSHGWSFSHAPVSAPASKPQSSAGAPPAALQRAASQPPAPASHPAPATSAPRWPDSAIQSLTDLGASREHAISFLDAANGNIEVAASLLFQQ